MRYGTTQLRVATREKVLICSEPHFFRRKHIPRTAAIELDKIYLATYCLFIVLSDWNAKHICFFGLKVIGQIVYPWLD